MKQHRMVACLLWEGSVADKTELYDRMASGPILEGIKEDETS